MLNFKELFSTGASGMAATVYNYDRPIPEPFAFVLNVAELTNGSSVEVADGQILRPAIAPEIELIKEVIRSLFGSHFGEALWEKERPASGQGSYVALPLERWRYFVISLRGSNVELDALEKALAISECDLQLGFVSSKVDINGATLPACIFRPPELFQSLSSLNKLSNGLKAVTEDDAAHIRNLYTRLRAYDHSLLDLRRVFNLLLDLRTLPRFSPLQVLGYFAVLETMLTHPPNPDDRYDSLTRQVTRKLALLNNRWSPQLDYSLFRGVTHDKLWSKMYAYRSAIAHGAEPEFPSRLSLLGAAEQANKLIVETVKQAIRHCLIEPQLLIDLRNC